MPQTYLYVFIFFTIYLFFPFNLIFQILSRVMEIEKDTNN